jgi:hypothetical protein
MRTCAAVVALAIWVASVSGQNDPATSGVQLYSSTKLPPLDEDTLPLARATLGPPSTPETDTVEPAKGPFPDCDKACPPGECKLPGRWTVRHDIGDGVGFTRGFTYLECFVPYSQPCDDAVWFSDVRVVNFDDADRWEFNVGGGYRTYAPGNDAVLGLNLFYDGRHTDTNFFHQIGVGAEAIFARCEFRCNGYIIVGPHEKLAHDTGLFSVPLGTQLLIARILTHDVAMGGVDLEGGVMLPAVGAVAPRVFVGGYHYSAERMPSVNGIRGRLEAWLGKGITLHFAIQHDQVFDTTVSGGIALHSGGADAQRTGREDGPRGVDERLGQRVVRDVNIVVAQRRTLEGVLLPLPKPGSKPPKGGGKGEPPPPIDIGEDPPDEEERKCEPPPPPPPPPKCIPDVEPPNCLPCPPPPKCIPWPPVCLPFPGRPGDYDNFPGRRFPPGFHHPCFPGRGRYKHYGFTWPICWPPRCWDDD